MVQVGSETNNVKWIQLTTPCNQINLELAWGFSKEDKSIMSGVKTKMNSHVIFNTLANQMITLDINSPLEMLAEILDLTLLIRVCRFYVGMKEA